MDITRRRKIALILNILVIAFAVIGTVLMLFPYSENEEFLTHGFGNLKYFTVLSNECCGIIAVVCLVCTLHGCRQPMLAKFLAAAAVGLTFLTIVAFLGPMYGFLRMFRGANFFFHLILPLTAMAEFVVYVEGPADAADENGEAAVAAFSEVPFRWTLYSMIPVAVYGSVYLGNCLINGVGQWPHSNDFYGFLNWGLPIGLVIFGVIMLAIWGIACSLRGLRNAFRPRRNNLA